MDSYFKIDHQGHTCFASHHLRKIRNKRRILWCFEVDDKDIACRVRGKPRRYASRFPNQFTIRYQRDNGTRTELEKIIDGWGDWFFYGHEHGPNIYPWYLIDLSSFRAALIRDKSESEEALGQMATGLISLGSI